MRPASVEDQTRNCKEGAETNGFTVVQDYIKADTAKSGASPAGRTALDSLIVASKTGPRPFDCILIDDTLARTNIPAPPLDLTRGGLIDACRQSAAILPRDRHAKRI
jgi:hypothetical protein